MVIGKFGKYLTFKVYMNPKAFSGRQVKCLTFEGLKREVSCRTADHARISRKHKVQFIGPDIASMTFTIQLSADLGVNPRKTIEKLESCVRYGKTGYFVLGTKKIGKKKYLIHQMSESWGSVIKDGKLVSANVDISMKEYV